MSYIEVKTKDGYAKLFSKPIKHVIIPFQVNLIMTDYS